MEIFDILRFVVDKRQNLTMTDVYAEVGNVDLSGAELGTYEYGFSMTINFDQANKSEFVQFSTDGGTVWHDFSTDVGNSAIDTPINYNFFLEAVSGDLNFQVQVRKEDNTGVLTVQFVDTYIKRVQ